MCEGGVHGVAVGKRACVPAGWPLPRSHSGVGAGITVLGVFLTHQDFLTTAAGYRQLLAWACSRAALITSY
jgi:hypothetical protein